MSIHGVGARGFGFQRLTRSQNSQSQRSERGSDNDGSKKVSHSRSRHSRGDDDAAELKLSRKLAKVVSRSGGNTTGAADRVTTSQTNVVRRVASTGNDAADVQLSKQAVAVDTRRSASTKAVSVASGGVRSKVLDAARDLVNAIRDARGRLAEHASGKSGTDPTVTKSKPDTGSSSGSSRPTDGSSTSTGNSTTGASSTSTTDSTTTGATDQSTTDAGSANTGSTDSANTGATNTDATNTNSTDTSGAGSTSDDNTTSPNGTTDTQDPYGFKQAFEDIKAKFDELQADYQDLLDLSDQLGKLEQLTLNISDASGLKLGGDNATFNINAENVTIQARNVKLAMQASRSTYLLAGALGNRFNGDSRVQSLADTFSSAANSTRNTTSQLFGGAS